MPRNVHSTVWLARHAEVHNPRQIFYGRLPRMRLSAEGNRQAEALARFLAVRPLQAVYTSPMLRARKTAQFLRAFRPELPLTTSRDLLEVATSWQGYTAADLDPIQWDYYGHRRHPDDETLEQIRDRMQRWLRRVLRRHAGGEIAAVSHGDPILVLVSNLRGVPLELRKIRPQPYIPTAVVFGLEFDRESRFLDTRMYVPHLSQAAA